MPQHKLDKHEKNTYVRFFTSFLLLPGVVIIVDANVDEAISGYGQYYAS